MMTKEQRRLLADTILEAARNGDLQFVVVNDDLTTTPATTWGYNTHEIENNSPDLPLQFKVGK